MKPNRKEDQYYYDFYDSATLERVREFQRKVLPNVSEGEYQALNISYGDFVRVRYRERDAKVKKMISEDEEKDKLVAQLKAPVGIKCESCGKGLIPISHLFDTFNEKILFVFECVNRKHKQRTFAKPSGEILYVPRPGCKICGEPIKTKTKKEDLKLTITDKCTHCGQVEVTVFTREPNRPINERDRKKFCLTNYGRTTFMEDLKSIEQLLETVKRIKEVQKEKKKYNLDKIQRKTIPQIKDDLKIALEADGFTELTFEKPQSGRFMIVPFSIMDSVSRKEDESVRKIKKLMIATIANTNWRISGSIEYRLGYISGKLKGVETDDDLMDLASTDQT